MIDSSETTDVGTRALPMPVLYESLDVTASKMRALVAVLHEGRKLAVLTGYNTALTTMKPVERDIYIAWKKNGVTMPSIDWSVNKKAITGGAKPQKKWVKRAAAMRELFENDEIEVENASWLTADPTYMHLLPLIQAVTKVQSARRHLTNSQCDLTDMEISEFYIALELVAVCKAKAEEAHQKFDNIAYSFAGMMQLFQDHADDVEIELRDKKA